MAEAIAVLNLTSTIASLVDLGAKVVSRLHEFNAKGTEVPGSLRALATRLPLLTAALTTLQTHAQTSNLPPTVVAALIALLTNTTHQISYVQTYLADLVPTTSTSKLARTWKALKGISKEDNMVTAVQKIHQDIDVLVLHQNTRHSDAYAHLARELSQLRLKPRTQVSIDRVEQQFSHITISNDSKAHIGNLYDYRQSHHHHEDAKPRQLVPRTSKCGLCLGSSPKIDRTLFYGRRADLRKIRDRLHPADQLPGRQCVVLGGFGGIGKTQLALHYADYHRDLYDSVFWLNASSEATVNASFRAIAEVIFTGQELRQFENQQITAAVRQWLSDVSNCRWLLLYDNYDEPQSYDIAEYYPQADHGAILVTTRLPQEVVGHAVRIGPLEDIQDGLAILRSRSKRTDIAADQHAHALAQRLAGLPLALATAGTYLETSPWTCQEYLDNYKKRWNVNPYTSPHLPEYKRRTLYTTWDISYARLQAQQPKAAQLLKLIAYFDNQKLCYGHFEAGTSDSLPTWLQKMSSDSIEFENLMSILVSQCFVEVQIATQSYSIHAAVHDWTLAALNRKVEPLFYWYAFNCVRWSLGKDDQDFFGHLMYSASATHAQRLGHNRFIQDATLRAQLEERYDNTRWVAEVLRAQMLFKSAENMLERALAGTEKALGRDHTSTLDMVHHLGILYTNQRKLDQAEEMYKRAFTGYEKVFGQDHISTLNTVNNLGNLYRKQGKLDQAEEMHERALAGTEKALGRDHTWTLTTVYNLGVLYADQGKLDQAEEMHERALAGTEKALGRDHTWTLTTVYNLGVLYADQGKLDQAEEMYERALAGREKALGQEHPSTMRTRRLLDHLRRRR